MEEVCRHRAFRATSIGGLAATMFLQFWSTPQRDTLVLAAAFFGTACLLNAILDAFPPPPARVAWWYVAVQVTGA